MTVLVNRLFSIFDFNNINTFIIQNICYFFYYKFQPKQSFRTFRILWNSSLSLTTHKIHFNQLNNVVGINNGQLCHKSESLVSHILHELRIIRINGGWNYINNELMVFIVAQKQFHTHFVWLSIRFRNI